VDSPFQLILRKQDPTNLSLVHLSRIYSSNEIYVWSSRRTKKTCLHSCKCHTIGV